MKNIFRYPITALLSIAFLGTVSCGQEEESNVAITVPQNDYFLVPSSRSSCYEVKMAQMTNTPVVKDITSAYMFVPRITISRKEVGKPLTVTYLEVSATASGGDSISVVYDGEKLAALKNTWWSGVKNSDSNTSNEYIKPPYTAMLSATEKSATTDCNLYLGGFPTGTNYNGTVTLKIYGFEGDENGTAQLVPFAAETSISVRSIN